jgi:GT2 family glycosyltransferase
MKVPPSPPAFRHTVAAVIPHWNRRDLLGPLLDNLAQQLRPFDEIIVVDNGSTDGSPELARGHVPLRERIRVVQLERNLGFAAAVNRGIETAHSDWIAILNNDVTLAPNWLEVLLDVASREGLSFATGKILSASNPSVLDGTFDEVSRGACAARCGSGKSDSAVWNEKRKIRFAPMTAALFRASLFHEVGHLDEDFGSYMEDVEFGLRCALQDRCGAYIPGAIAYHQGSATLGKWSADSVWRISRNQFLLFLKHFRGQSALPIIVGQALWGLVAFRHGCGWAFLRGKMAGWSERRALGVRHTGTNGEKPLGSILRASENEIWEIGQQTGLDLYWRAYFWLLPR